MEATAERINFYVATEVKNGRSSVEIHDKLVVAWGEQKVCSLRQIQRIAKKIKM